MEYKEIEVEVATPTSKKSIVFASIGLGLMSFSSLLFISIFLLIFSIFTFIPALVFSILGLIFGIKDKRKAAIIMSSISLGFILIIILLAIVINILSGVLTYEPSNIIFSNLNLFLGL